MVCLNCGKNFLIKRTILTLFSKEIYFLCPSCYERYKIELNMISIPIERQEVEVYSLFKEFYYLNIEAFVLEFSQVFKFFYEKNKDAFYLILDICKANEDFYETLEIISTIFAKKVVVICAFMKN